MPCYRPITVSIKRKSIYNDRGFSDEQTVPCGNCVGCRAEQGRQWAVRMMHETRMHRSNLFVTLTLDDENLNENREVCPRDFSGFVKSLRKAQEAPLSFFGCGEYGQNTGRPHYHAVLFGVHFGDFHRSLGRDPGVGRSDTLDDLWGKGLTEIGTVTMASASYVAGYVRKKLKAKDYARANPITGELLTPEFARMSLRPAIGKRWIEKYWRDVYPRDYVVIDGVEAKPPRFYDKWLDQHQPDMMEHVRQKRCDEAKRDSKRGLRAAEVTHEARLKLFSERATL